MTATPILGSILLASTDPDRLRGWYERALQPETNEDGFLIFGTVAVLIDHRDDIDSRVAEPGRVILNLHVENAHEVATQLDRVKVTWLSRLEQRDDGWFGAFYDPDGNIVQIIEFTEAYLRRHK
jgi:hypothetical protein